MPRVTQFSRMTSMDARSNHVELESRITLKSTHTVLDNTHTVQSDTHTVQSDTHTVQSDTHTIQSDTHTATYCTGCKTLQSMIKSNSYLDTTNHALIQTHTNKHRDAHTRTHTHTHRHTHAHTRVTKAELVNSETVFVIPACVCCCSVFILLKLG